MASFKRSKYGAIVNFLKSKINQFISPSVYGIIEGDGDLIYAIYTLPAWF